MVEQQRLKHCVVITPVGQSLTDFFEGMHVKFPLTAHHQQLESTLITFKKSNLTSYQSRRTIEISEIKHSIQGSNIEV